MEDRKDEPDLKILGLHKMIDDYNRKLLNDKGWGLPMTPKDPTGYKVPKAKDVDAKSHLKQSVFDGNILKEPRERATTAQKKLRDSGELELRKSTAIIKTIKPDGVMKKSIVHAPNTVEEAKSEKRMLDLKSTTSSRPGSALSVKSKSSVSLAKKPNLEGLRSNEGSVQSKPGSQAGENKQVSTKAK